MQGSRQGFKNEKTRTTDEFLIEKRGPVISQMNEYQPKTNNTEDDNKNIPLSQNKIRN